MGIGLMAAQIGMSIMAAAQKAKAAQATSRAIHEAEQLRVTELARQQGLVNIQAQEQRSDRVRAADVEFASAMVGLAETGAGGTTTSRYASQVGFEEGIDLARIEANREEQIQGLVSEQEAADRRARNAASVASSARRAALFELAGAGLSIAASQKGAAQQRATAEERV